MITIQAGNYANFVGAHIFNLQNPDVQFQNTPSSDQHCPNVLWREVEGKQHSRRVSCRPRVVVFDTLQNVTVDVPTTSVKSGVELQLWDGKVENVMDEQERPSKAPSKQNANRHHQSWREMINWKISQENMHLIPNFSVNPESGQLSSYSQGLAIWKSLEEPAEDSIRKYAEECDRLEGFNLLIDQLDGFSGIGGGLLQYLSDEYDKKLCLGFGLCSSSSSCVQEESEKGRLFRSRMSNTTLLWDAFNSHSSVFSSLSLCQQITTPELTPLVLPYLNYNFTSYYESSSILAATLDTLMSPCISTHPTGSSLSLSELASFLGAMGRKMTSVSTAFPYSLDIKNVSFFATLKSNGLECLHSLTPGVDTDLEKSNGNYFALRGIPLVSTISEKERKKELHLQKEITTPQSCLELYVNESFSKTFNIVRNYNPPLIITDPFPVSIVDEVARDHFSISKTYSNGAINSWSHSCISSAHNSTNTGSMLEKVLQQVSGGRSRGKVTQNLPQINELGMEGDDFMDAVNNLEELKGCYDDTTMDI